MRIKTVDNWQTARNTVLSVPNFCTPLPTLSESISVYWLISVEAIYETFQKNHRVV